MSTKSKPKLDPETLSGRHYSRSGEASRGAELERVQKLSPIERLDLALSLGRRRHEVKEKMRG